MRKLKVFFCVLMSLVLLTGCGKDNKKVTVTTSSIYNLSLTFSDDIVKDVSVAKDTDTGESYFFYDTDGREACLFFHDTTEELEDLINSTYSVIYDDNFKQEYSLKIKGKDGYAYNDDLYGYTFIWPIKCKANGNTVTIWAECYGSEAQVNTFMENTKVKFSGLIKQYLRTCILLGSPFGGFYND